MTAIVSARPGQNSHIRTARNADRSKINRTGPVKSLLAALHGGYCGYARQALSQEPSRSSRRRPTVKWTLSKMTTQPSPVLGCASKPSGLQESGGLGRDARLVVA